MPSIDWQVAASIATVVSTVAFAASAIVVVLQLRQAARQRYFSVTACMSSEPFGQVSNRFKRGSGTSELKLWLQNDDAAGVVSRWCWGLPAPDAVQAGTAEGHGQGVGDIGCGHGGAQLPGQDVAREVIEHGRQIEPAPADHPQVSEISLPELIGCGGWLSEGVGRLHQDEGGTGNQIMRLQEPIDR